MVYSFQPPSSAVEVSRRWRRRCHLLCDFALGKSFLVDPAEINYLIRQEALKEIDIPHNPSILDGNWDLLKIPIEETELFKAFHHRFSEGGEWQDTAVYKNPEAIGARVTGAGGPLAYTAHYEKLFESIRDDGFKTGPLDEVIHVHVGRNGELIRHDGWHRLTIAKILNVRLVKVKIFHRHKLSI